MNIHTVCNVIQMAKKCLKHWICCTNSPLKTLTDRPNHKPAYFSMNPDWCPAAPSWAWAGFLGQKMFCLSCFCYFAVNDAAGAVLNKNIISCNDLAQSPGRSNKKLENNNKKIKKSSFVIFIILLAMLNVDSLIWSFRLNRVFFPLNLDLSIYS